MRTHRIAGAAVAAALLAGTALAPSALAAPPAATATAQSAVPFTSAGAVRAADGGHTLSWASPAASVAVTAVTSPDATTGVALGTAPGTGSLTVPPERSRRPGAGTSAWSRTAAPPGRGRPLHGAGLRPQLP